MYFWNFEEYTKRQFIHIKIVKIVKKHTRLNYDVLNQNVLSDSIKTALNLKKCQVLIYIFAIFP